MEKATLEKDFLTKKKYDLVNSKMYPHLINTFWFIGFPDPFPND